MTPIPHFNTFLCLNKFVFKTLIYKSMETSSCHSNQSSYPIEIRNTNIRSPPHIDAICEIRAASEEKSFENNDDDDGRPTTTDDARTPARPLYYKLTCEPSAQVT